MNASNPFAFLDIRESEIELLRFVGQRWRGVGGWFQEWWLVRGPRGDKRERALFRVDSGQRPRDGGAKWDS